jgi:DNA-directed RNA polymerase specialized sigma24 family protein
MTAWGGHKPELRAFLLRRLYDPDDTEDLLQDLFVKALDRRD